MKGGMILSRCSYADDKGKIHEAVHAGDRNLEKHMPG